MMRGGIPAGRYAAYIAFGISGALILACLSVDLLEALFGHDHQMVNLNERLLPPSLVYLLGTDELGRDHFLRLLHGGRISLIVGFTAALASAFFGAIIGVTAGYIGGRVDDFLMRFTDSVIALPLIPLLLILAVVDLEKLGLGGNIGGGEWTGLYRVILIVSLVGWTGGARLVRAATLSVRERAFIHAAEAMGCSPVRIMAVHILPNVISPLIVATSLAVGQIILLESALSFLGFGVQPPIPSWGNMLTGAQDMIWEAPWLIIWPGIAIFTIVAATNVAGDFLQDYLDRNEE